MREEISEEPQETKINHNEKIRIGKDGLAYPKTVPAEGYLVGFDSPNTSGSSNPGKQNRLWKVAVNEGDDIAEKLGGISGDTAGDYRFGKDAWTVDYFSKKAFEDTYGETK